MAADARNWAGIPSDILYLIAEPLMISDFVRLLSVCTSWALALKDFLPSASHFPWMLLLCVENNNKGHLSFFSPLENRYYRLPHFPKIRTRYHFVGYKDAWLVVLQESLDVSLVNPLTGAQIALPPFSTLHDFEDFSFKHINKIVLSSSPAASDGSVAVAIYNSCQSLAYARPGSAAWTPLYILPKDSYVEDIVYHRDKFFVLSTNGQLHAFSLSGPYLESSLFMKSSTGQELDHHLSDHDSYLVSACSGDLLHVKKSARTREITIMRFEPEIDSCWVETKELGNESLFLDSKYCMSVSARYVEEVKQNCIFMINERPDSIKNVVMYDIEKRVTWPCISLNISYNGNRFLRPLWIVPSLLGIGVNGSVESKIGRMRSLFHGSDMDGSSDLSTEQVS